MRARRPRDDSGQMMTALVIGLCMTLLAFLVVALVPVGAATNEKTRSQTAADAAALAAAERIRTRWVDVDTEALGLFHPAGGNPGRALGLGLGMHGRGAAESFAASNDARVVSYSAALGRGRVSVEVENTYSALEGTEYGAAGRARSTAEAEMDADFEGCRWSERPPGLPTLESTPPGPDTFEATLTCGAWSAEYTVSNSAVLMFPVLDRVSPRSRLYDALEPRLVG